MKITKYGHCCLLIEENGLRILTDPGSFTADRHIHAEDIDIVLFTHEHQDHYHLDSLKTILEKNSAALVLCNPSVGTLLEEAAIPHRIISDREKTSERGVAIEGFGSTHAMMHSSIPQSQNTGYFIAERLWYPGDAFTNPQKSVEILAMPISGPWMKLSEGIDFCLEIKPRIAFGVHDMILNPALFTATSFLRLPPQILSPRGIEYRMLELEQEYAF